MSCSRGTFEVPAVPWLREHNTIIDSCYCSCYKYEEWGFFSQSCSAQTWRERPTEQSCPPSKPRESFLTSEGAVFLFPSREQTIAATSLFSEVAQEVRFSFLKIISFVSFFYSKLKFIFFRSELLLHSPLWMLSSNVLHEIHTFCCF